MVSRTGFLVSNPFVDDEEIDEGELARAQAALRDLDEEDSAPDGVDERFHSKLSLAFDVSNEPKSSKAMLTKSHQALLGCKIFEAPALPNPHILSVKSKYGQGQWKAAIAEGNDQLIKTWTRQG